MAVSADVTSGDRADRADPSGPGTGGRPGAPRASVVVPRWGTGGEEELATGALVAALARTHGVEIIVLRGSGRGRYGDGAAEVVEVGGEPPDAPVRAVVRRAIAAAAAAGGRPAGWLPEPARTVLEGPCGAAWEAAYGHVTAQRPAAVVLAGADLGPGLDLFALLGPRTRRAALPLADHRMDLLAGTAEVLRAADVVLATGPADRAWLEAQSGSACTDVGVHLGRGTAAPADLPPALRAAPGAGGEVPPGAGDAGYVAVVDSLAPAGAWANVPEVAPGAGGAARTAAWLGSALRPYPVVAIDGGDLVTWERGRPVRRPLEGRGQRDAVVASARAVVAVEPGPVLAVSVLTSLLHSRPVVTAAGTLGAAHVRESSGGVVVEGDAQLLDAVRELADDPRTARSLGCAGARWAGPRYDDAQSYAARVGDALAPGGGR